MILAWGGPLRSAEKTPENQSGPTQQNDHAKESNNSPAKQGVVVNINPNSAPRYVGPEKPERENKEPSPGEWGLIFVGLIQAGVLAWQIWFLGRTLAHERERTGRELRAYVFVHQTKIHEIVFRGNIVGINVRVIYGNDGKTPANNVRISMRARQIKIGSHIDLNDFLEKREIGPLGPDDERSQDIEIESEGKILDKELAEQHVWGRIDYEDTFGIKRWTIFHAYIGGDKGWKGMRLHTHRTGNDYY
jgi:hypothetical protein